MAVYLSESHKYRTNNQRMQLPEVEVEAIGLAFEGFSDCNTKVVTKTGVLRDLKCYFTKMEEKKTPLNNPTQKKHRQT